MAQVSSCVLETILVYCCSTALLLLKLFSLEAKPHHSVTLMSLLARGELLEYLSCIL